MNHRKICVEWVGKNIALRILAWSWPYAVLFWAAFLFAYIPEFRLSARSRRQQQAVDRGSRWIIMLAAWIAYPLAFYMAGSHRFRLAHGGFWFSTGIILLLAGSGLRRYCWRV